MKKSTFIITILLIAISFSSCEEEIDSRWNLNNTKPTGNSQNTNQPASADTIRLFTIQNNNFTNWVLHDDMDIQVAHFVANYTDNSSWGVYIGDGNGNFNQVNRGDYNHWEGMVIGKGTLPNLLHMDAIIDNDLNQWRFESDDVYNHLGTYYIRTNIKDDFNSFVVFTANNDSLFQISTGVRDNFNSWNYKSLSDDAVANYNPCFYFIPIIIAIKQPQ